MKEVKKALEKEGYEGDGMSVADRSGEKPAAVTRTAAIQVKFRADYRLFEGKIYLPHFCVKNGRKDPEKLDYFRHLLSQVDVARFSYASVDWDLAEAIAAAKEQFYRISLEQDDIERIRESGAVSLETDDQVAAWLVANLSFDYFSQKELRYVVRETT
jgi:hypothetical protein